MCQCVKTSFVLSVHWISLTVSGHNVDLCVLRGVVLVFRIALHNTLLAICVLSGAADHLWGLG